MNVRQINTLAFGLRLILEQNKDGQISDQLAEADAIVSDCNIETLIDSIESSLKSMKSNDQLYIITYHPEGDEPTTKLQAGEDENDAFERVSQALLDVGITDEIYLDNITPLLDAMK